MKNSKRECIINDLNGLWKKMLSKQENPGLNAHF